MPILGNLSEFPLPEILLLIGVRTGRLRLLDVPEFGLMDVDVSNGEVQAMHLGGEVFTERDEMIRKLSSVVQVQGGMFEFRMHPVASINREHPLRIDELVMTLVCHVDEQVALQKTLTSPDHRYVLVTPQPEIWVEPELNHFFHLSRQHLILGSSLYDLAKYLELDEQVVHMHLTNLRLLGLLSLVNINDNAQINELRKQGEVSRKSNEFLRVAQATKEIKRLTGGMPQMRV